MPKFAAVDDAEGYLLELLKLIGRVHDSHASLPGGIRTAISGIGIYYPDGGKTQRVGIVPDIEVKPTIQGIKDGRDEALAKAIELINGK